MPTRRRRRGVPRATTRPARPRRIFHRENCDVAENSAAAAAAAGQSRAADRVRAGDCRAREASLRRAAESEESCGPSRSTDVRGGGERPLGRAVSGGLGER